MDCLFNYIYACFILADAGSERDLWSDACENTQVFALFINAGDTTDMSRIFFGGMQGTE